MFKKWIVLFMACVLVFSVAIPNLADAKSSYRSPSRSFSPVKKAPSHNVTSKQPASTTTKAPGTAAARPGFFSGGLLRGLFIGGIAGMLFGGMFGGMGAIGNMLGLFVNVLAIYFLYVIIRNIVVYFLNRKKWKNPDNRY